MVEAQLGGCSWAVAAVSPAGFVCVMSGRLLSLHRGTWAGCHLGSPEATLSTGSKHSPEEDRRGGGLQGQLTSGDPRAKQCGGGDGWVTSPGAQGICSISGLERKEPHPCSGVGVTMKKPPGTRVGMGGVAGGVWSDCCPIPHIPLVQGPGGWDHLSPLYKYTQK